MRLVRGLEVSSNVGERDPIGGIYFDKRIYVFHYAMFQLHPCRVVHAVERLQLNGDKPFHAFERIQLHGDNLVHAFVTKIRYFCACG